MATAQRVDKRDIGCSGFNGTSMYDPWSAILCPSPSATQVNAALSAVHSAAEQNASTCPSLKVRASSTYLSKLLRSSMTANSPRRLQQNTWTCPMNSFTRPHASCAIALCDARGRLNPQAIGWSPRPRIDCALPGHVGRRKRWNPWCITTPHWMLVLTQADFDYVGYGAAYFLDLSSGQAVAHSQLRVFARDCGLPDQPEQSHEFRHPRLQLRVIEQPGRLRLTVAAPDIGGQPLQVDLDIQRPAHLDSVNLVAPLGQQHFHATCRQMGLPASGSVQLGSRHYGCVAGHSFAAMDFGRGVWPLRRHSG